MRTLFGWLEPDDVWLFGAIADSSLKSAIDGWLAANQTGSTDGRHAISAYLSQALFSRIYLFYCNEISFIQELRQWLGPWVELVFLEISHSDDGGEISNAINGKIIEISDGKLGDCGILQTCSNSVVRQALSKISMPHLVNYTIADGRIHEEPPEKIKKFISTLKPVGLEDVIGVSHSIGVALVSHRESNFKPGAGTNYWRKRYRQEIYRSSHCRQTRWPCGNFTRLNNQPSRPKRRVNRN